MPLDCPRCDTPLLTHMQPDHARHDCACCGGTWVRRAEREALLAATPPGPAEPPGAGAVVYHRCPECHAQMHRRQLGRVSGVVIEECVLHGSWFAAGQLAAWARFVHEGGAERTAAAEARLAAERARDDAARAARRARRKAEAEGRLPPPWGYPIPGGDG